MNRSSLLRALAAAGVLIAASTQLPVGAGEVAADSPEMSRSYRIKRPIYDAEGKVVSTQPGSAGHSRVVESERSNAGRDELRSATEAKHSNALAKSSNGGMAEHSSCCATEAEAETHRAIVATLPEEGLFQRWRSRFTRPTLCPVYRCHGTCAETGRGCSMRLNSLDLFFEECVEHAESPTLRKLKVDCCGSH